MGKNIPHLKESDEDLCRSYAQGSEEAFRMLYSRYSEKLYSFLMLRLGSASSHLCDELFQKTWLKVHLAKSSFNSEQKFSTWFFTIAMNSLRDAVGASSERLPHSEWSEDSIHEESGETSESQLIQKELVSQIRSFLTTLPESQRIAVLLADEEGMTSKEIAQVMGQSDSAVRQLISRARRAIRAKFSREEYE